MRLTRQRRGLPINYSGENVGKVVTDKRGDVPLGDRKITGVQLWGETERGKSSHFKSKSGMAIFDLLNEKFA